MILDGIFVTLIGMSCALGFKRGFTDELIRLVIFIVSAFGAYGFFRMSPYFLQSYIHQDLLVQVSSGFISIVGLLIFFKIAKKFLINIIKATPLAIFDKTLGCGFGLIRGIALVIVLYWIAGVFLTQQLQPVLPIWKNLSQQALDRMPLELRTMMMEQFLQHHTDFSPTNQHNTEQVFKSLADLKPKPTNG